MTEREKLLSGPEYNSRDEELIAMYHRARALTKSLGRWIRIRRTRKPPARRTVRCLG